MFKVGETIVCPMRGCGVVQMIEERMPLDTVQEYLIIKIAHANTTLMIPTDRVADSQFRSLSDLSTVESVFSMLKEKESEVTTIVPYKQRFKDNMVKFTSGSLKEYAQIVSDLTHIQKTKILNSSEKSMLINARNFFIDEVSIIKNISKDKVDIMLSAILN